MTQRVSSAWAEIAGGGQGQDWHTFAGGSACATLLGQEFGAAGGAGVQPANCYGATSMCTSRLPMLWAKSSAVTVKTYFPGATYGGISISPVLEAISGFQRK